MVILLSWLVLSLTILQDYRYLSTSFLLRVALAV